jgi:flagellar basal body-associated protein FliL
MKKVQKYKRVVLLLLVVVVVVFVAAYCVNLSPPSK